MVHAADGRKFSKRRGNGINPLDVVKEHNTDTLRTYLAFMGPIELPKNWNPDGVAGVGRFLKRFEKMVEFVVGTHGNASDHGNVSDNAVISVIHQTIKAV
jgi:leucyl-tRNA synthetase